MLIIYSESGKTTLLVNLLLAGDLAQTAKFDRIVFCYGEEEPRVRIALSR